MIYTSTVDTILITDSNREKLILAHKQLPMTCRDRWHLNDTPHNHTNICTTIDNNAILYTFIAGLFLYLHQFIGAPKHMNATRQKPSNTPM